MSAPPPSPGTASPSTRPLAGRTVAVTRDGDPQDPLAAALEARGARVLRWPTLVFEPPEDPRPLDEALADLAGWDWIVFTSARAVEPVTGRTPTTHVATPFRVAAVGEATAAALRDAGWPVHAVGEGPGAEGLASTLAASAELDGARILFPAASLARDTLGTLLEDAGARVHQVEAYRTGPRGPDPAQVRSDLAADVDAVTFLSPSAVDALASTLDADGLAPLATALAPAAVVAIGPTTAEALARHGLAPVVVAHDTSLDGVVDAVERTLSHAPA